MKFMLEFPARDNSIFQDMALPHLKEWLRRLEAGMANGSIDSAYSKVGGGGYFVVNAEDDQQLRRALRGLGIHEVDVVPVSATADVVKGYIDFHESGDIDDHREMAEREAQRMHDMM